MENEPKAVFTTQVLEETANFGPTFVQEPRIALIKGPNNKIYAKIIDWDTRNEGDLGWTDQELENLQKILEETRKQIKILDQSQ
jgi:Ca2+-dependent lipid-binding protein